MRKIIFGGANSLDNYLARPDDGVDWLLWGEEAAALTREFWTHVDTILMGRKTYEIAVKGGSGGENSSIKTYVFSRTLTEVAPGAVLVKDDAAGFVRNLKAQEGHDICLMGGGDFARSLFEADLIDEIGFNIHPVLLGAGILAFYPMSRQIDLELKDCRPFKDGCVYVAYRVKHAA